MQAGRMNAPFRVGRTLTRPRTLVTRSAGVPPAAAARSLKAVNSHAFARITPCGLESRAPGEVRKRALPCAASRFCVAIYRARG